MTRVKICGVTRIEDRDAVVDAGVDAVGVVSDVSVDTPREIDPETAVDLLSGVPPFVTSVLVTMPDSVERAVGHVETVQPDVVQVHGGLEPSELGALRRRVECGVVAAVDAERPAVAEFAAHTDAVLVDSAGEDGGGGTGRTHDWERTRDLVADLNAPVVLAGGLTPENVADAVRTVRPFAVDVASGVEASGGVKDHEAVERFVANARRAEVSA